MIASGETTFHMSVRWLLFATLLGASVGFGQNSRAQVGQHTNVHVAFPEIHDWNSLRITLSRSGCYGGCPAYSIEIHGDGTVLYEGKAFVDTKGRRTAKLSHAKLVELVDVFRNADYFSLSDRYASAITDWPKFETSISFDGVSKSVLDYAGQQVGMPSTVSDVEAAIDRVSGASKWVGRKKLAVTH
jgi:hypothetical protein